MRVLCLCQVRSMLPQSPIDLNSWSTYMTTHDVGDMICHPSPYIGVRTSYTNIGNPHDRCGHYNAKFVQYSNISLVYCIHCIFGHDIYTHVLASAKEDPKEKATMLVEFGALDKNGTWGLMHLDLPIWQDSWMQMDLHSIVYPWREIPTLQDTVAKGYS